MDEPSRRVTLSVSIDGEATQVALVLDASESARNHWESIASKAIETIRSLPASTDCRVYFLGSGVCYPGREFEANIKPWFEENSRRVSLIGPVIRRLTANGSPPASAVIGSGLIYDLEDWIEADSEWQLTLFAVGDPLCASDLARVPIARSVEQLVAALHDPVIKVDISAPQLLPLEWTNCAYQLHLIDGELHLIAETAEQFDVRLNCEVAGEVSEFCWAEKRSGARLRLPVRIFDEEGHKATTVVLTEVEASIFRQAIRREPFPCPECGRSHAWDTMHCGNASAPKYRFNGCPLYPTLADAQARGFIVCRQIDGKVCCEVLRQAVLRHSESRVLASLEGRAQLLDYDARSLRWTRSKESILAYVALMDGSYVLNYR